MALQSIRYGGGVWKQHEELRLRLEVKVESYERELALQKHQLLDSQEANAALQQELQASQSQVFELDELLGKQSQEVKTLRVGLVDANQRHADRELHVKQLQHELKGLGSQCEQQQELLSENTSRIARLELQVAASQEEELRLCELLYAEQEKNEAHDAQLAEQQRELRILTRANRVKSAQNDALAREKAELAQTLAKLRGANPNVHFASSSASSIKTAKKNRELVQSRHHQRQPTQAASDTVSKDNQRADERDGVAQSPIGLACSYSHHSHENKNASDALGGFLWKELQLMSAKLHNEQRQNAQLRDQIDALEISERALMAHFREASAA